jgi:hypothetical protein
MTSQINSSVVSQRVTGLDSDCLAFEAPDCEDVARQKKVAVSVSTKELLVGLLALVLWFGLFSGGILIGTEPYRAALENPSEVGVTVVGWFLVCVFWTITNIGLLACVAAFLGALGRRTRFTLRTDLAWAAYQYTLPEFTGVGTYYVSAIMRGFGIYVLVLAGLLVLATESLASPTQEAYMRLAPTVSIISFYAGFDPSMFAGLLDRVKSFLQTNNDKSSLNSDTTQR